MALPCDGHLPNGGPRIKALSYMVARDISIINGCLPFVYMYFSDQFSNVMEDEHVHNETEDDQDDDVLLEYDDKKHAETMEANTDNSSRTDDGTLTTIKQPEITHVGYFWKVIHVHWLRRVKSQFKLRAVKRATRLSKQLTENQ